MRFRYLPQEVRLARDDEGRPLFSMVRYSNPKPANFEDADQLVIEGYSAGDHFVAENILVKCPSKYNDGRGLDQTAQGS